MQSDKAKQYKPQKIKGRSNEFVWEHKQKKEIRQKPFQEEEEKSEKSMTNKSVDAPKGFHWMKSGKSYKLMKGDYKPHKNAVKKASFSVQAVHKK